MQLKALELQGFKSFPERTVLRFDAGITAVVGPNGSGKSNLSDALRWVMGEQSTRALRGGKMEDVIFGGTPTRKRLGFAEVSITLDNEDGSLPMEGSELTVTRRYYRSGDSEYYINRRLCRLRDVHELFMDTGLGQEGYSLIGQGKIDEILSVKSTQRREVFEEAAGISRYRHRKEEAERKLSHTRENLLRISDKLEELSLQLDPLAKQAETTQRYRSLQDALRTREVSLWMHQLHRLRAQQQEQQDIYAKMQDALVQAEDACTRLYATVEDLQRGAQEAEAKMETARQEKARLEAESAHAKQRSSVLAVQMDTTREHLSRLRLEEQSHHQREGELLAQESLRREEHSSLCLFLTALQQEHSSQQEARSMADQTVWEKTQALSHEQDQREQLQSELQRNERSLAVLDASTQELSAQETRLLRSFSEATEQQEEARKVDEALQQERLTLSEQWNQERLRCKEVQHEEERIGQEAAALQEAWVSLRMEENALSSRVRLLAEMERLYEGYSKSVKTVMERVSDGELPGVHGPLASLVEVSQPYALAIEMALGGALQHLVVSTQEDGKTVLSALKRHDGGRVTCLPLDAMRASRLNTQDLSPLPGYLGLAAEHVSCDPTYETLLSHLLGKVVLVSDLDCGIAMARQFHHRFRIVTLDGQVLAPGGAMTGGSVSRKGGILTRASELSALRDKQDALHRTRLKAERSYERAKVAHQQATAKLELEEQAQTKTEQRILLLDGQMRGREAQIQEQVRQLARLREEIALLEERKSQAQLERTKLEDARSALQLASQRASDTCLTAAEALQQAQRSRDYLQDALQELQTKLAVSQAQQRALEQALAELSSRRESFASEAATRKQEMQRLEAELLRLSEESNAQETHWFDLQSQKDRMLQALETLAQEKLSLEASRSQAERDSRSKNETLLRAQKEAVLLEQTISSAQQEEALLLSKLWDQYELSHEAARALAKPFEDWAEVTRDIASLRGQLRALGTVNLAAIEEYARVRERFDYLSEQKRDVVESDRQLTAIIRALTDEMKTVFQREFLRIGDAFGDTFRELFGGGSAQLLLEDPQDILTCGIEIRVSPPGKHLRSLSLLSGGEKAFVAIALYFAILKIHPTPFCVLDEIEAALDDANVLRFARYLRGMTKHTQFIVITHRRGTMEEADLLYGITMEQQGVSRILSLNLTEAEEKFSGSAIG